MRQTLIAAVLALSACAPATGPRNAQYPSSQYPSTTMADEDDDSPEHMVCREERTTGTNMTRTVCRTRAEIAEQRRAAQEWEKHPRSSPTN